MSKTDDRPSIDKLVPLVLLGNAEQNERDELSHLLAASALNRSHFLNHASLYAMLAQEARAGAFTTERETFFYDIEEKSDVKPARFSRVWVPAAAACVLVALVILTLLPTSASAALEMVVSAANAARDRTYTIKVIEAGHDDVPRQQDDRGRFPAGNYLDNATLWLGRNTEFLLKQELPDGSTRIMGSNDTASWSMRGNEPVRLSDDPKRFGGWIFSKNREFAFLDLRSQLEDLKKFYRIEAFDRSDPDLWRLLATRQKSNEGGPRDVELWFDPDSGLLKRMILRQLPQGNGGPRSIEIRLESVDPLPADFFTHNHHHEPERAVLKEPHQ